MHLDNPCPACGNQGIIYNSTTTDVPYFGETLETLIHCAACGFKHTDILVLGQKDPVRYSLHCTEEAHLFGRVVRSSSGTMRIPELGVMIEPGPISEAFVSNVEGVLERVLRVVGQVTRSGNEKEKANAAAMIERIAKVREGGEPITLILEDPLGNSAILHPEATKEMLTPEQASRLKTGMTMIDLEDLAEQAGDLDDDDDEDGSGLDVDDLLRP